MKLTPDFFIGIASYKRPKRQITLDYLNQMGICKDQIILSVQCDKDYFDYKQAGINKRVGKFIFNAAKTAGGNRNNILNQLPIGSKVLLLDDDVHALLKYKSGKMDKVKSGREFCEIVDSMFNHTISKGGICFTIYHCDNGFWCKGGDDSKVSWDRRFFRHGC